MKRYVPHFLGLLNVGLVLALLWLWFTPTGALRNVHWQPPQAQKTDFSTMIPVLSGIVSPDTSRFIAMLDRPLFSMTRRPPPPPPPVAAEPVVDNLTTARLLGVFQGAQGGGIILHIAGKDRRVRVNELVDGWTVQTIQGRDVIFARSGKTRTLTLSRAALTAYTGAPIPPFQGAVSTQSIESTAPPAPSPPKAASKAVFGGSR